MKTLKLTLMLIAVALLICSNGYGQTIHKETVVTISGIDYGPGIGTVFGTYTTKLSFKLDKNGYMENLHCVFVNSDLVNTDGDKVLIVGGFNDNLGILWNFLNNPNASNAGYNISYDVEDGWLNDYMPPADQWPVEGHWIALSAKLICNGYILPLGGFLQIHINANGDVIIKP